MKTFCYLATVLFLMLTGSQTSLAQSVAPPLKPPVSQISEMAKAALENGIQSLQLEREQLADQVSRLSAKLDMTLSERQQMIENQDQVGISPESFDEVIRALQAQNIQLEIDLAGLEARREHLHATSKELNTQIDSEVLGPLQKIMKLAQENLVQKRDDFEVRKASAADVREAERQVLLTEIQIAEARREDSRLSSISNDLYDTSLERAEKQARLDTVREMLDSITALRNEVEKTNRLDILVDQMDVSLAEKNRRLQRTEEQLRSTTQQLQRQLKKPIAEEFETTVLLDDGKALTGIVQEETDEYIKLIDANDRVTKIMKDNIEARSTAK